MSGRINSKRRSVGILLALATIGVLAAFTVGLIGEASIDWAQRLPLFDTLAHFRAHLSVILLLCAVVLLLISRPVLGAIAGAAGLLGICLVAPYVVPQSVLPATSKAETGGSDTGPNYTLLQMNLKWDASDRAEALRTIGRLSPDLVTLEEASKEWQPLLARLADRYPYRSDCPGFRGETDAVILSRRPFVEGSSQICADDGRLAARAVDFNGVAVTVVAQHLRWPWPASQWRQMRHDRPQLGEIAASGGPILIAGDFNATPWSAALKHYAELTGTKIVPHVGTSWFFWPATAFVAPYAGLPIDNVLVSKGIAIEKVERMAATTSDHLPVLVTFSLEKARERDTPASNVAKIDARQAAGGGAPS